MGKSDVPANLDKIIEVTGNPKVSYVGYSQGTSQMLYGLSTQPAALIADKLDRAILLAPCIFLEGQDIDGYMKSFPIFRDVGVNTYDPVNWPANTLKICVDDPTSGEKVHPYACQYAGWLLGKGWPIKALELYD